MSTVGVRYIVDDVDEAVGFYCERLGFDELMHPAPTFALLSRGDLRLALSAPAVGAGGGQILPDGQTNQILLEDPAGNPIELFEPTPREARLSGS